MSRWRWALRQMTRRLWVRSTLIGGMGIAAAILATVVDRLIPWELPATIGADAVESILTIIATSMLAVTTFSLSVMTAAFAAASSGATPRATRLLMEDRVTQSVLSTFLGAFLFGIVGIVVLKTGAYGDRGRVVLFVVTIAVIALIVVSLLRWIDHLTRLGRLGETTDRVERAARCALEERLQAPALGGTPLQDQRQVPAAALPVTAEAIGYVQQIDIAALDRVCQQVGGELFIRATPGAFVPPAAVLAWVVVRTEREAEDPPLEEAITRLRDAVRGGFNIGGERSFEQDPRFGMAVLGEIGSRALSAATNDAGTALDVIGRMARLLSVWAEGCDQAPVEPRYPRVHVPPVESADLFEDAFMLMARDGAGLIEVQLRLQKVLLALSRLGDAAFQAAALQQATMARERAEAALSLEADRTRLREVANTCG